MFRVSPGDDCKVTDFGAARTEIREKEITGKSYVESLLLKFLCCNCKKEGLKNRRNGASGFGQLGSIDSIVDTRA